MVKSYSISLEIPKTHPRGVTNGTNNYKNTMALSNDKKIVPLSILCQCKHSIKEYTAKMHLYFNV